jgi:hypothetical protein
MNLPKVSKNTLASNNDLQELLTEVGDIGLSALATGVLDDIPILGLASKSVKAVGSLRDALYLHNISRFLIELDVTSKEKREAFTRSLAEKDEIERFGQNVLLLIEKADDTKKPTLMGRVMAACVSGHLNLKDALRLCAMLNRCYATDLDLLVEFKPGEQRENTNIAEALFSAGFLSQHGISGGDMSDPQSGGVLYELNDFGRALVQWGLDPAASI